MTEMRRPEGEGATPTELADGFLAELRRLRARSGQPSYRRLSQLAEQRIATAPPESRPEPLPPSTVSEVLAGKRLPRLPRWGFVESFVAACLLANGADAAAVATETARWRERWCALAEADEPGPAEEPAQPGPRPHRRWITVAAVAVVFLLGAGSGVLIAVRSTGDPAILSFPPASSGDCETSAGPVGENMLTKRTITSTNVSWWINNQHLGTVHGDVPRFEATVPSGTQRFGEVLAILSDVKMELGRRYVLVFTARAAQEATIRLRVQGMAPDHTKHLEEDFSVGTSPCRRVFRFTGHEDDPRAELTFQVGGLRDLLRLDVSDIALMEDNE